MEVVAYRDVTVRALIARRTAWLGLFLAGLLLCTTVMHKYELLLQQQVELAVFVPLLIGHAGNSGGQTISAVIRSLGDGTVTVADAGRISRKEALAGAVQSVLLVALLLPYFIWAETTQVVRLVVSVTMVILGLFANTCGAILPFVCARVGVDPALIAAPLMTTAIDTFGVWIYLSVAIACMTHLDV